MHVDGLQGSQENKKYNDTEKGPASASKQGALPFVPSSSTNVYDVAAGRSVPSSSTNSNSRRLSALSTASNGEKKGTGKDGKDGKQKRPERVRTQLVEENISEIFTEVWLHHGG